MDVSAILIKIAICITSLPASLVTCVEGPSDAPLLNYEQMIFDHVMQHYISEVRPANHSNETLPVYFGMAMVNIVDLQEKNGILELNAWLRHYWYDRQLRWDPSQFGTLEHMVVPAANLWKPDIVLFENAADTHEQLMDTRAHVYYNGMVLWVPHVRVKAWCTLDMYKFPFDSHTCELTFGSWSYNQKEMDIQFYERNNLLDMSVFGEHHEWEVHNSVGRRKVEVYACCPESYVHINYQITFKRKPNYYTHIFVAPAILMVLLIPSLFILPPTASEKVVLGTGIMVSLCIMLSTLESFLPSTHLEVPAIAMFYLTGLVLVSISQMLSVCVLNLSRRSTASHPPKIISTIFVGCLGRILCVSGMPYSELVTTINSGSSDVHVISTDDHESIIPPRTSTTTSSDWITVALMIRSLTVWVLEATLIQQTETGLQPFVGNERFMLLISSLFATDLSESLDSAPWMASMCSRWLHIYQFIEEPCKGDMDVLKNRSSQK